MPFLFFTININTNSILFNIITNIRKKMISMSWWMNFDIGDFGIIHTVLLINNIFLNIIIVGIEKRKYGGKNGS